VSDGSAINLLSSILVSDMTSGGAAVACARLRKGLVDAGQKARWFALKGEPGRGALITDWIPGRVFLAQRLISRFCSRWQGADSHLNDITMADGLKRRSAGVINLHNLHEGMSFGFLQRLPADVPIVWTLHDMWPLTGYCCYSYSCSKYIAGCPGDCPQANLWGAMTKKPGQEWRRRQLFFLKNSARVSFVSPSKWLANCARERLPPNMSVNDTHRCI
jgi:hypothetical protein